MNSTQIISDIPLDIATITGWSMFLISEILPFIRKKKQNNGILHTFICLLKGSKCMIDNVLKAVDIPDMKVEDNVVLDITPDP